MIRPAGRAALAWSYVRFSGAALLALALGHLLVTHYVAVPSQTTAAFVAGRWSSAFWLAFDWLLLAAALSHGLVGLQGVVDDYVQAPAGRRASRAVLALLGCLLLVIGSATMLAFDPVRSRAAQADSGPTWIADLLVAFLSALATLTYLGLLVLLAVFARRRLRRLPIGRWVFPGQWAWAAHRASGLSVLGFLVVHLLDVLLLPLAPDVYDRTIRAYGSPYLIPMEALLVAAVLYHALNGARLIVTEAWAPRGRLPLVLIRGVAALTIVLLAPSVVLLLLRGA